MRACVPVNIHSTSLSSSSCFSSSLALCQPIITLVAHVQYKNLIMSSPVHPLSDANIHDDVSLPQMPTVGDASSTKATVTTFTEYQKVHDLISDYEKSACTEPLSVSLFLNGRDRKRIYEFLECYNAGSLAYTKAKVSPPDAYKQATRRGKTSPEEYVMLNITKVTTQAQNPRQAKMLYRKTLLLLLLLLWTMISFALISQTFSMLHCLSQRVQRFNTI